MKRPRIIEIPTEEEREEIVALMKWHKFYSDGIKLNPQPIDKPCIRCGKPYDAEEHSEMPPFREETLRRANEQREKKRLPLLDIKTGRVKTPAIEAEPEVPESKPKPVAKAKPKVKQPAKTKAR